MNPTTRLTFTYISPFHEQILSHASEHKTGEVITFAGANQRHFFDSKAGYIHVNDPLIIGAERKWKTVEMQNIQV